MKSHKCIKVVWRDATSIDGWISSTDLDTSCDIIETVGLYVAENSKVLTVGLNWDSTIDHYSCIINIPKSWIIRRKWVKC